MLRPYLADVDIDVDVIVVRGRGAIEGATATLSCVAEPVI
jgi:hypothetical protein